MSKVFTWLFWGFVALDALGLLLLLVLGLAAAGPSGTSPLSVVLYLLVLRAIPLVASRAIFLRSGSTAWRALAFLLAAARPVRIRISPGRRDLRSTSRARAIPPARRSSSCFSTTAQI